jgi:F-type H+-transporting ATPase subunit delta
MADNASTARPYAKAIFELAQESATFDGWSDAMAKISAIVGDESFTALASDPRVESARIADLLIELSQDVLPTGGDNFINLLVQNDRLGAVHDIAQQYSEMVAKAQASVNAEVITARALSDSQKANLEAALEQRLGLKVSLQESVDPSLIGGAIVKAGDLVIDGSARGRIEKLTSALLR